MLGKGCVSGSVPYLCTQVIIAWVGSNVLPKWQEMPALDRDGLGFMICAFVPGSPSMSDSLVIFVCGHNC